MIPTADQVRPGRALILRGDARRLPLADNTVDLVVTSPPYFSLRSYEDGNGHLEGQIGDELDPLEYVAQLVDVTREAVRVLKPRGSLFVNLGDKYAERGGPPRPGSIDDDEHIGRGAARPARGRRGGHRAKSLMALPWRYAIACIDELGLILRAEIVWSKPNAMPESVRDRVARTHETWLHLTPSPRHYADVDPIREPHATSSIERSGRAVLREDETPRPRGKGGNTSSAENMIHPAGKLPPSVWTISASSRLKPPACSPIDGRPLPRHFAAFPIEWPRRLISAWCPPGGVVLDPFAGTGTTPTVAAALGRLGIGVELSHDYARLARWRVEDRRELLRVQGRRISRPRRRDTPTSGQLELIG